MGKQAWPYKSAAGRWAGFGPYYAMFPVDFAKNVIESMCPKEGAVLDPFCGRGTAPYVAQVTGRGALGIDINPVAWVFARAKTMPERNPDNLFRRMDDLRRAVRPADKKAENDFQRWAWSPQVLGFLKAARRELDWLNNQTDRTLMGFALVHLHAKLNDGVSNQMPKAKAVGPDYAVRWWKSRRMKPPDMDPCDYFHKRINWRYFQGVIGRQRPADIVRGDSVEAFSRRHSGKFDLLFTSPPYFGITDYRHDSWIRLWLLGENPLPDWKKEKTASSRDSYKNMLVNVFAGAERLLKVDGIVWVRTDARKFTKEATLQAIRAAWPNRNLYMRHDCPQTRTQTAHFGDISTKPGEVDFVIPGKRVKSLMKMAGSRQRDSFVNIV